MQEILQRCRRALKFDDSHALRLKYSIRDIAEKNRWRIFESTESQLSRYRLMESEETVMTRHYWNLILRLQVRRVMRVLQRRFHSGLYFMP